MEKLCWSNALWRKTGEQVLTGEVGYVRMSSPGDQFQLDPPGCSEPEWSWSLSHPEAEPSLCPCVRQSLVASCPILHPWGRVQPSRKETHSAEAAGLAKGSTIMASGPRLPAAEPRWWESGQGIGCTHNLNVQNWLGLLNKIPSNWNSLWNSCHFSFLWSPGCWLKVFSGDEGLTFPWGNFNKTLSSSLSSSNY